MAVAHGTDKALLLEHKAAIDRHLRCVRNSGLLHQRLLGRTQRDQAVGDFAADLSRMVGGAGEVVAAGVDRGNVVCVNEPRSPPSATGELFAIRKIEVSQQSDGKLLTVDLPA